MDELLIEDKKYISSKRAAKVTGYAKDYIGQLCREGRVPARLVGRGWYVLESALQDHRFGAKEQEEKKSSTLTKRRMSEDTWEAPRYEATPVGSIPVIQKEDTDETTVELPKEENSDTNTQDQSSFLQDSWREWFDHIAESAPTTVRPAEVSEVPQEQDKEVPTEEVATEEEHTEVSVPIRAIYELPPDNLLPKRKIQEILKGEEDEKPFVAAYTPSQEVTINSPGLLIRATQAVGLLLAVISLSLAGLNSGYFDKFIISFKQAALLAGVLEYNK